MAPIHLATHSTVHSAIYSAIYSAMNEQVVHTQQLVKVDEWLHLRVTPRDAVLLKVTQ